LTALYISTGLFGAGAFFVFLSAMPDLKLPDTFNRLGWACALAGVAVLLGGLAYEVNNLQGALKAYMP